MLTYFGGTDRTGELRYNFSVSNDLTQRSFPSWISDLYNGFPFIGKFWSCSLSFHWRSIKFTTGCLFHCIAHDYSCADWDGVCDHLRDVPRVDIFKLSARAAAHEFCELLHVEIDIYIPHHKYQVKPHLSP